MCTALYYTFVPLFEKLQYEETFYNYSLCDYRIFV